ncbi:MAG: amino acid adenylation domain-containing protein, partial [Burkholderiales bacterium]|nr:amino acid adenylation domain-containing protein [Burkholderiales bacterium]
IGRPMANTRIHILDAWGQPCPIGVAGELHIAGAQIARGYLNRPELTAERFVPDPFGAPGSRMYRSGDLARWRADGSLDFLGRNDHQVKIRGFRIELGEIDAALQACPGVREAVVLARQDGEHKRLVAYLVGEESASPEALRTQLSTRLPEYMLPAAYVRLPALPLTPNGKLDRQALPEPDASALGSSAYEPPQGPVEETLAALWCELLGLTQVGRHDDFFALGGHSLLAVHLLERMRQLGWALEVRALFASPILARLAATVTSRADIAVPPNAIPADCARITPQMLPLVELTQQEIDLAVAGVPGGATNVQDIYALAPLQQGMLFHHLLRQQGDPYVNPVLLAFDTRASLDAFVHAFNRVIARHDILRTAVVWRGMREPAQVVWRNASLPLQELEIDGEDAAHELRQRFDAGHTPIDLQLAPLIRGYVAQDRNHGRWLLHLLHHHMVMDHTTLELLVEEIQAHLSGNQHALSEPLPFRNFVAQARLGVSQEDHEAYFRSQLADVDEPTAPYGLVDVQGDGTDVHEARLVLEPALTRDIRSQARKQAVSAATIFHLAYALVLARLSARDDVVFGTALFGRMHGGLGAQRVLGMFLNTLPLRAKVDARTVRQALEQMQLALAELLQHEHASLALAQKMSGVAHPAPLFTAGFNYRHAGGSQLRDARGAAGEPTLDDVKVLYAEERSSYPVVVKIDDDGQGFQITANLPRPLDPERLGRHVQTAVAALVRALRTRPDTPLNMIEVLEPEESDWLVRGLGKGRSDEPCTRFSHELFEEQVGRTPGAVALEDGQGSLTYAELNTGANRLAAHLRSLGVRPDTRVAIALQRGPRFVMALLAVLKAGGAYVPLDPTYPAERLAYMLDDSRPRVVLTESAVHDLLPACRALNRAHTIDLDGSDAWQGQPGSDLSPDSVGLRLQHLAYVIYTSGSTGQPKGTMVSHAGLGNLALAQIDGFALKPDSRVLQFASPSFDACVSEILMALLSGATLCLPAPGGVLAGDSLVAHLARQRISHVTLPPALLAGLEARQDELSLQVVVMAGEHGSAALAQRVRGWAPKLINAYGPTEATVCASMHHCREHEGAPPIGRPLQNTGLYVLNRRAQPCPIGVAGELHIAGTGLARGYLNRPELTAERFVPDPFCAPGSRMYRSGDLARWRADGTLDFLGRNDHQVKIRGFRIELGEIEAALQACPGVREAVVLARQGSEHKRLVAYLVGEESTSAEALRTQLSTRLPEYMLPAAYVRLPALPLTPNGKLDR